MRPFLLLKKPESEPDCTFIFGHRLSVRLIGRSTPFAYRLRFHVEFLARHRNATHPCQSDCVAQQSVAVRVFGRKRIDWLQDNRDFGFFS
jgi:hypothetical protein